MHFIRASEKTTYYCQMSNSSEHVSACALPSVPHHKIRIFFGFVSVGNSDFFFFFLLKTIYNIGSFCDTGHKPIQTGSQRMPGGKVDE